MLSLSPVAGEGTWIVHYLHLTSIQYANKYMAFFIIVFDRVVILQVNPWKEKIMGTYVILQMYFHQYLVHNSMSGFFSVFETMNDIAKAKECQNCA